MKNNRLIALVVLPVVIFSSVMTASGQKRLPELLDEGIRNYPGIKARLSERESYKKDVSVARAEYMPRVTAQHQYTYATSNSLAGAFYPNPAVISPSGSIRAENINEATWGSYTSAIVEWNVFNFGKVSGTVNAAEKTDASAEARYENELLQHKVKIADAYLLTLMYGRLARIQEVNLLRVARATGYNRMASALKSACSFSSIASGSHSGAEYRRQKIVSAVDHSCRRSVGARFRDFARGRLISHRLFVWHKVSRS
jgi:hypothetical protein